MLLKTPSGLDQIIATFGSIDKSDFEARNIVTFTLPYPLRYDGKEVKRSRCHRLLVENFQHAFELIKAKGLDHEVRNYSGIYAKRAIRGFQSHPSTHSWGIAIDAEAARYPLGSSKRFPDEIVTIFKACGFVYGGDFKSRRDPMHWQFAKNY